MSRSLRVEAGFSGRVREVAILITARCCDSQFEWAAHEDEALREGVPRQRSRRSGSADPSMRSIRPTRSSSRLGRETFQARKVKLGDLSAGAGRHSARAGWWTWSPA